MLRAGKHGDGLLGIKLVLPEKCFGQGFVIGRGPDFRLEHGNLDAESGQEGAMPFHLRPVRFRRRNDPVIHSGGLGTVGCRHVGEVGFDGDVLRGTEGQGQRLGQDIAGADGIEDDLRIELRDLGDDPAQVRVIGGLCLVEGYDEGDMRAGQIQVRHPPFAEDGDLRGGILGRDVRQHGRREHRIADGVGPGPEETLDAFIGRDPARGEAGDAEAELLGGIDDDLEPSVLLHLAQAAAVLDVVDVVQRDPAGAFQLPEQVVELHVAHVASGVEKHEVRAAVEAAQHPAQQVVGNAVEIRLLEIKRGPLVLAMVDEDVVLPDVAHGGALDLAKGRQQAARHGDAVVQADQRIKAAAGKVLPGAHKVVRVDLDGVELRVGQPELAERVGDDPGRALAQIGAGLNDPAGAMVTEKPLDGGGELGLAVDLGEVELAGVVFGDLHASRCGRDGRSRGFHRIGFAAADDEHVVREAPRNGFDHFEAALLEKPADALLGVEEGVFLRTELLPVAALAAMTGRLEEADAARRKYFGHSTKSFHGIEEMFDDIEAADGVELVHRELHRRKESADHVGKAEMVAGKLAGRFIHLHADHGFAALLAAMVKEAPVGAADLQHPARSGMIGGQHAVPDGDAVAEIVLGPLLDGRVAGHVGLMIVPVLLVAVERLQLGLGEIAAQHQRAASMAFPVERMRGIRQGTAAPAAAFGGVGGCSFPRQPFPERAEKARPVVVPHDQLAVAFLERDEPGFGQDLKVMKRDEVVLGIGQ